MKERTPSVTAGTIAAHRAIDTERPAGERICNDPLARSFLTPGMKVIGKSWIPEKAALWIYEKVFPGFHSYFAIRTRYLDDCLAACLEEGLEQLVILGAGYDSRAYRFEKLRAQVAVFEVDHPATQQAKLRILRETFGAAPHHVSYVAIDFGHETLAAGLRQTGYDPQLKTLFLWEGVTYYITAAAVDETLAFVAGNSAPGSSIVFDYTHPDVVAGTSVPREARAWRRVVRRFGEPLVFGIDDDAVEKYLLQQGFDKVINATHDVFRKKYLSGTMRQRSLTSIFGIARATVGTELAEPIVPLDAE